VKIDEIRIMGVEFGGESEEELENSPFFHF
jgi:hypothetical protein